MVVRTQQTAAIQVVHKPRVVRSKDTWQHLINLFDLGSQAQADFCQEHDIAPMSFYKWRKQLSSECAMIVLLILASQWVR